MNRVEGFSLFFRRLSSAPAAQKRAVGWAALGCVVGSAAIGWAAGADPIACGMFGLVVSVLPSYLILVRSGKKLSYSLFVPPEPQQVTGYREAAPITAALLVERLAKHGYRLEVALTDSAGAPAGPAAPASTPLIGVPLWFREASESHGGISLALPPAGGAGALEVVDGARGVYAELAKYLMLSLGELVRGTEFKESFSSLSPESTEWLRPQVPDRPLALRKR